MQPVPRRSLTDEVAEALRAEILDGVWAMGERIPNEAELGQRAGVGRNTVREAVQVLVQAGLLERRQGSGTYVIATTPLSGSVGRVLGAAERREVVELRLALEVSAAALAAWRRTSADLRAVKQANDARLEARRRSDAVGEADADVQLHRAVVVAAHNDVMLEVYDSVLPRVATGVRDDITREAADGRYDQEHVDLVTAITDGAADGAGDAARRLLLRVLADEPTERGRGDRGATP